MRRPVRITAMTSASLCRLGRKIHSNEAAARGRWKNGEQATSKILLPGSPATSWSCYERIRYVWRPLEGRVERGGRRVSVCLPDHRQCPMVNLAGFLELARVSQTKKTRLIPRWEAAFTGIVLAWCQEEAGGKTRPGNGINIDDSLTVYFFSVSSKLFHVYASWHWFVCCCSPLLFHPSTPQFQI